MLLSACSYYLYSDRFVSVQIYNEQRGVPGTTSATSFFAIRRNHRFTRATKRRTRLATRYESDTTHRLISSTCRYAAVDTESPIPVPIAMYAATHTGHFGTSARMAPGAIHPAISRQRRANAGSCGSPSIVPGLVVSRSEAFGAASQHRSALTSGPPPNRNRGPSLCFLPSSAFVCVLIFVSSVKPDRSTNRVLQFKYKTNKQPLSVNPCSNFFGAILSICTLVS